VDVIDEKVRRPLPTVTGIAARLTITALKTHNVAIAPLLQRAGFSAEDFDVRHQRISAASQGKFLEYAAEALDDSAFGLHLVKEANPREAGLLFYVTSAASNVGEALALFARYSRIVNEAVRIKRAPAQEGSIAEISFTESIAAVLDRAGLRRPILLHGVDATVWPCVELARQRRWSTQVGLEDGKHLPDGTIASDNAALVIAALAMFHA
jgi:hypothetical protein